MKGKHMLNELHSNATMQASPEKTSYENETNTWARDTLIPKRSWAEFKTMRTTKAAIETFARQHGISPAIEHPVAKICFPWKTVRSRRGGFQTRPRPPLP